jgi:hypothetical protein
MKKLLLFSLILFSFLSNAQIKVLNIPKSIELGKVNAGFYTHSEITYIVDEKDTVYTFRYMDARYKGIVEYKSVDFKSDNNTLNEFYNICKSVFSEENRKNKNYIVNFKLGNDYFLVKNTRMLGITYVTIGVIDKGYTIQFLESQIDKLFGKEEE